eukprot:CAMPEP_0119108118 /NCGR_PEP_ID=MMETSP1180-20130426/13477_1 /TAXON_ID=3052 ORGANISM="Chlamydomonas cf sp, Strain CCMP681" /NCGR_SAMPLE_ID=MMETSP1180 /ASSEMBLY_ACC=CAM_ASM_000741 /LENGTH=352 /DNA_ID=CAMNT_0007093701 /DNA_START=21 /DNA_END=1079 /DNA_ORIENTATION=-
MQVKGKFSSTGRLVHHAPGPGFCLRAQTARRGQTQVQVSLMDLAKSVTTLGMVPDLKKGIANFYDESSELWEGMWGAHMHHGYYKKGEAAKSNEQAQIDMINHSLDWAGVVDVTNMVDVGCGIGGSTRHVLGRWPRARAQGITLSPKQAARANELTRLAGLGDQAQFQVADALAQPFSDDSFDLVWSMESGEHMPNKPKFVNELVRVCAPGGKMIIVTWCHRVLGPGESLRPEEVALLERISEAYYLPAWCSVADYTKLLEAEGMVNIRNDDWSEEVTPFWGAVIKTALSGKGLTGLFTAGWTTIKGALVMPLMAQGFSMGTISFVAITAEKPSRSATAVSGKGLVSELTPV